MPMISQRSSSQRTLALVLRASSGTITVEDVCKILHLSATDSAKRLARWAEQGWLSRVRRGLYVPVPLESLQAGDALADPVLVGFQLLSPCYIGGWSAAEQWGLTEQVYRSIMILTTTRQRTRSTAVQGTTFVSHKVSSSAMFGLAPVWHGRARILYSNPSRTIADLMVVPALGGGIRPCADMLHAYLTSAHKDIPRLLDYTTRLKKGVAFKRLGFLLEKYVPEERDAISHCRKHISAGNSKLDPALPADRVVTAWRLWVPQSWKGRQGHD